MDRRGSGLLLHITSLPSNYGLGDLGPSAFKFADFLSEAGQIFWQILPLNPVSHGEGNSPYSSSSAFAGNSFLISPDLLIRDGLLSSTDVSAIPEFPSNSVDYDQAVVFKNKLLDRAFENFKHRPDKSDFEKFCIESSYWLDDYVLFIALKESNDEKSWSEWPVLLRDREPGTIEKERARFKERIEKEKFFQYIFYSQWEKLKGYCSDKGIQIVGDLPIYMSHQSADVWVHPDLFKLDEAKKPAMVSGVPPDYFSATGQLWGNPVYRWDRIVETQFEWWLNRIRHNLRLCDILRIDHFRGLVAYWEVPAGERTAINGKWVMAPGDDFFRKLTDFFPKLPIIAEDLGTITPDVKELMDQFNIPGMKVLLFAFGDKMPQNPYIPHNHVKNCLVYTGTHDNDTIKGWYGGEASDLEKNNLAAYLGRQSSEAEINWELIRMAMMSVADMVLFPMQDILGLGAETRMNTPSTMKNNWRWRLSEDQLTGELSTKLRDMTRLYNRLPGLHD